MSIKSAHRTCEICGTKEAHSPESSESLFFANFPLDENRCREWVQVCGNEDLVHLPIEKLHTIKHVCGQHFKKTDFNKNGHRLKKCAVPGLNLKASPLSSDQTIGFPLHMFAVSEVPKNIPTTEEGKTREPESEVATTSSHAEQSIQDSLPKKTSSTSKAGKAVESRGSEDATTSFHKDQRTRVAVSEVPKNIPTTEEGKTREPESEVATTSSHAEQSIQETSQLYRNVSKSSLQKWPQQLADTPSQGVKRKLEETEEFTPRKKKLVERLIRTQCTLRSLKKKLSFNRKNRITGPKRTCSKLLQEP